MGSSYTQELEYALRDYPRDKAALRPGILRLAKAVRERAQSSDKASLEFVKSGVALLARLGSPVCSLECHAARRHIVQTLEQAAT